MQYNRSTAPDAETKPKRIAKSSAQLFVGLFPPLFCPKTIQGIVDQWTGKAKTMDEFVKNLEDKWFDLDGLAFPVTLMATATAF